MREKARRKGYLGLWVRPGLDRKDGYRGEDPAESELPTSPEGAKRAAWLNGKEDQGWTTFTSTI